MRSVAEIFAAHEEVVNGRHVNGTDKHGPNHQYGHVYDFLIQRIFGWQFGGNAEGRNVVTLMMEVGIADGSSLLAWREVFPNALCVGLDIHPSAKAHGDRIEFHLGDASKLEACERAVAGRQFDFVCEDASHRAGDSLLTLLYLWPHVRPGGLYVIEEFYNIGALRDNVNALWPFAEIVDTVGPSGGVEPLVVFRKPK